MEISTFNSDGFPRSHGGNKSPPGDNCHRGNTLHPPSSDFPLEVQGGGAPPLGFPESTLPAPLAFGHCTAHTKDFLAGTDRPAATALLVPRKSRACVFWRGPLHCSYQAKILESSAGFNSAEVRGGVGAPAARCMYVSRRGCAAAEMYVCTPPHTLRPYRP